MNLSRFRLITFDVTHTLLNFRVPLGQQYGVIGELYGVLSDKRFLSENFKEHISKMLQQHPNYGLNTGLGWEEWWKNVVKGTFKGSIYNLDDEKLDSIATHLIEVYKTSAVWQHCFGTPELLSYIRSRNIPMGVISNFDPRLKTILANTKLDHYFQFILSSYEVGVEKPDTRIFEEAMKLSKLKDLKPEDCLHIGDTTLYDYYGARKSGWHGILINDTNPQILKEKHPDVDPNHLFASLYQLHQHFLENSNEKLSAQSLGS